jgi:hypothetical protein
VIADPFGHRTSSGESIDISLMARALADLAQYTVPCRDAKAQHHGRYFQPRQKSVANPIRRRRSLLRWLRIR